MILGILVGGHDNFVEVIGFGWLVVVDFGFRYLTRFVLFFTPFNSLAFVSVEGWKRITEEKKER